MVDADTAKVTFVFENEGVFGLEQDEVVMFAGNVVGPGLAAELAAHPEVYAQPPIAREVKKHLFAASVRCKQHLSGNL